ncbi:sodium-coupled monocarboxylate transporter 1-like isoform X1 [Monodelphis domestica]|uniref:sodium-coupled monocarboxylate transporter 1-like isoform X1 n=1 Tax=Monodelphis domestica TaxID=13616 RepID=UPI0007B416E9|nr:sodium-coupled monocarboxylate transporter 1-like isoform X1 [Monodelphis domestica]
MKSDITDLSIYDYFVFGAMLLISALIGLYYYLTERHDSDSDFLMGGRQMPGYTVSLSLLASFLSALTVLGMPVEVYYYGAIYLYDILTFTIVIGITGEVYLPIFYRLKITSTYEVDKYLELRFNRELRLIGSVLFIVQMVLYTGIVICAPALALHDVTGLGLRTAVFATGVVCTFYCTVGGLKAVILTDVFQTLVMISGFLAVIIKTSIIQGGFSTIIRHSIDGGRLNFWEFDPNPHLDHTFWTMVVGGTFTWTSIFGINHCQVQRYVCCKTRSHAKLALYLNLLGLYVVNICAVMCGLALYSMYRGCDPYEGHKISSRHELMPYLALNILRAHRGLSGLFVSAAYSGTLSTVSSSINALAVVTIEDLIKPHLNQPSLRSLSLISKATCFFYGMVCVAMAGFASIMGSLLEATVKIFGMIGGPLLGLFTLGILNHSANALGSFIGLVAGFTFSVWVGIGSYVDHPPPDESLLLPISIVNCSYGKSMYLNWTRVLEQPVLIPWKSTQFNSYNYLNIYWFSYLYLSPMGTVITLIVGSIASIATGGKNQIIDKNCLLKKEDTILLYFKKENEVEVSESHN